MNKPSSPVRIFLVGWKGLVLPAIALAGAGALLVEGASEPRDLLAESNSVAPLDQDHDGLPDVQELVMGTSPNDADTDGDDYSDLEEFARQSDPSDADSVPGEGSLNIGLTTRAQGSLLYVSTALYMSHTETSGVSVRIGVMIDGAMIELPAQVYLANATIQVEPGKEPGDIIAILETPYPLAAIEQLPSGISFWTLVKGSFAVQPAAADAVNLLPDPVAGTLLSFELTGATPTEGVYRPIGSSVGGSWEPGKACFQASLKVGNIGPVAQHLVEAASCEPADGYCAPGCELLAGTSFQIVDPLALLGG